VADAAIGEWLACRRGEIFASAQSFIHHHSRSPAQRALLDALFQPLQPHPPVGRCAALVATIPLLTYAGTYADDSLAIPLAAAVTLFTRGVDILDDLADGDWPPEWAGLSRHDVELAGAEFTFALPQLCLAELEVRPATIVALQRTLADGFLESWAGQQVDLSLVGRADPTRDEVEACAVAKSGALVETQALLGAQLAQVPKTIARQYAAFGRALGTAMSIASDCEDLFVAPVSRDLRARIRTLPIAIHLEQLADADRPVFLALLERAAVEPEAQELVRRTLLSAGVLRRCVVAIAVAAEQARLALVAANPREPARSVLLRRVAALPFVHLIGASSLQTSP
jgi:geranylgeranyl pyrophosphate synthase